MLDDQKFSDGLAQDHAQEVVFLMVQARDASHRAKAMDGYDRRREYERKALYLSMALELAPERFTILNLVLTEGLVGLEGPSSIRLHVPVRDLTPAARAALAIQLLRFLEAASTSAAVA